MTGVAPTPFSKFSSNTIVGACACAVASQPLASAASNPSAASKATGSRLLHISTPDAPSPQTTGHHPIRMSALTIRRAPCPALTKSVQPRRAAYLGMKASDEEQAESALEAKAASQTSRVGLR